MTTPRQRITPKKGEQTRTLRKRQQCIDKRISPATILDLIPTTTKTNYRNFLIRIQLLETVKLIHRPRSMTKIFRKKRLNLKYQ